MEKRGDINPEYTPDVRRETAGDKSPAQALPQKMAEALPQRPQPDRRPCCGGGKCEPPRT